MRSTSPPPGVLVPLYERRLHLLASGQGHVTVVLDGANGVGSSGWREVARRLEPLVRVVRYDRAGYGWSDPAPAQPTVDEHAQDLHTALEQAGIGRPYVLVGQAYGAGVLRCFAHRYRREVIGMVLLQAWPARFAELAPPSWRRRASRARARLALRAMLARIGITGVRRTSAPTLAFLSVAEESTDAPRPVRARNAMARYGEARTQGESDREVATLGPLGDLPLIVIGAEGPDGYARLPVGGSAHAQALWKRLQSELVATSTLGRFWSLGRDAGVGADACAELVARAVRDVLAKQDECAAARPSPTSRSLVEGPRDTSNAACERRPLR